MQKDLTSIPEARVTFPSDADIFHFGDVTQARYPALYGMFGFVDGLKIYIHPCADEEKQNAYYNGWTCKHYISNVLLFTPDGCIAYSILNCPGSWHDSAVSACGGLYSCLLERVPHGYFVVADSAFPVHGDVGAKIKRAPKQGETSTQAILGLDDSQIRDLVAMRQSAEWGNRAIEGAFPRLQAVFPWEESGRTRGIILRNCVQLVNLRARWIGPSQIRNVWMPWLAQESNFS